MKFLVTLLLGALLSSIARAADPLPIVNVYSTPTSIFEGRTVSLNFATEFAEEITIHYALQGTATPNIDYKLTPGVISDPSSGQILIPQNQFSNQIAFQIIQDKIHDPNEFFTLRILPDPSYIIGQFGAVSIQIKDDDYIPLPNTPPAVTLVDLPPFVSSHSNAFITAYASDTDGTVAQVQLFSENKLIGTGRRDYPSYSPYYFCIWTNPPPGAHQVYVVATDDQGATGTSRNFTFVSAIDILTASLQGTVTRKAPLTGSSVTTGTGVGVVEWSLPDYATNTQGFIQFFGRTTIPFHHQLFGFAGLGELTTNVFTAPQTYLGFLTTNLSNQPSPMSVDVSDLLLATKRLGLLLTNDTGNANLTVFTNFQLILAPSGSYDIPPRIQWIPPERAFSVSEPLQVRALVIDPDSALDGLDVSDEFGVVGRALPGSAPAKGTNFFSVTLTNLGLGAHYLTASVPIGGTNFLGDKVRVDVFLPNILAPAEHHFLSSGGGTKSFYIVDAAGRAEVWGQNAVGQLGLGFHTSSTTGMIPQPVTMSPPAGLKWQQITAEASAAYALADGGSLWAWGNLNFPTAGLFYSPIWIPYAANVAQATRIAVGSAGLYLIDGREKLWILTSGGFWNHSGGWKQISVGRAHAVGIRSGDIVDVTTEQIFLPPDGETWSAVSAAADHALALTASGQLYAWGTNTSGQLPFVGIADAPKKVALAGVNRWTKIAAGIFTNLAADDHGTLYSWGAGNVPEPLSFPSAVTDWLEIAVTETYNIALAGDGRVFTWGTHVLVSRFPQVVNGLPNLLNPAETRRAVPFYGLESPSIYFLASLKIAAPPGTIVSLETSPDLRNWTPAMTFTNVTGLQTIQISNTANASIFYRLGSP